MTDLENAATAGVAAIIIGGERKYIIKGEKVAAADMDSHQHAKENNVVKKSFLYFPLPLLMLDPDTMKEQS